jgi:hypothetical protein
MTHENNGARPRLIAWSITGISLFVLATSVLLPRFVNATRPMAQPAFDSAQPALNAELDVTSVPQTVPIAGRVVDRKAEPVPGAKVYLYVDTDEPLTHPPISPPVRATSGADGRFRFTVDRIELASGPVRNGRYPSVLLAAFAEGYGPALTKELTIDDPDDNRLELVADDAPITGRLIDLEGRPLPDVTVRVVQVDATPTEDLSPWLSETQKDPKTAFRSFYMRFTRRLPAILSMLIPPAKTGPDGRFRLRGAGRERIVSIVMQGARVQTRVVQAMTRVGPSKSMRPPGPQLGQMETDILIHAIGFEHVAGPGRNVEGDVVDAATGQPVPGVVIRPKMTYPGAFDVPNPFIRWRSEMSTRATTDARGHYRLGGLPVGHPFELVTGLGDRMPYRPMFQELPNAPGVETTRLDFKLVRGIPVQGNVTNRTTGKLVAAFVEYRPTLENPNLSSPNDISLFEPIATRPDGSFILSALPGPGVVVATVTGDRFLSADRAQADRPAQANQIGVIRGITSQEQCQALEPIALEATAKRYQCDLSLVPAPEPIIRILDPDGKPLAGAIVSGAASTDLIRECWWQSRHHGVFRVTGLTAHRIRILAIHHEGRRLAGTLAVRDAEPGPLVAKLRPWGTVSGRLVDRAGRPRAGVALSYQESYSGTRPFAQAFPKDVTTDSNGRFTFVGLVPEQEYVVKLVPQNVFAPSVSVGGPHAALPGETKDLGDIMEVTR